MLLATPQGSGNPTGASLRSVITSVPGARRSAGCHSPPASTVPTRWAGAGKSGSPSRARNGPVNRRGPASSPSPRRSTISLGHGSAGRPDQPSALAAAARIAPATVNGDGGKRQARSDWSSPAWFGRPSPKLQLSIGSRQNHVVFAGAAIIVILVRAPRPRPRPSGPG